MIYQCTWKFPKETFSHACTAFSTMEEKDHKADAGRCKQLGRWHNVGNKTGTCICEAPSADDAYKWAFNWTEDLCEGFMKPMLDDNQAREIILQKVPDYQVNLNDNIGMEAPQGHSLFKISYTFYESTKLQAMETFAKMTKEGYDQDKPKELVDVCRFHDVGAGNGFVIVAAPNETGEFLMQKWAYNWTSVADIQVEPVITDKVFCDMIKNKKGYEKKLEEVKKSLAI